MMVEKVGQVGDCIYGVSKNERGFFYHVAIRRIWWWHRQKWTPRGNPVPTREKAIERARSIAEKIAGERSGRQPTRAVPG